MAEYLTSEDKQRIERAIEQYGSREELAAGGVQGAFCKDWPTIKQALDFLKGILPAPAPALISAVEWIGDKVYNSKVCKPAQ